MEKCQYLKLEQERTVFCDKFQRLRSTDTCYLCWALHRMKDGKEEWYTGEFEEVLKRCNKIIDY
jgi:hypothetical protein